MSQRVGCIIPAAGYGSVCPIRSSSKVVEETEGDLMIARVVTIVKQAEVVGSIVVVIGGPKNPYSAQVREALRLAGHTDVTFAVQPERLGAADAVLRGLCHLQDEPSILVTLGDMPAWRPATIRRLVETHLLDEQATISMVTVRPPLGDPIEQYGRIARDERGEILAAFEPDEFERRQLTGVKTVNPSLYVFRRQWFEANVNKIKPVSKDGYSAELHLPKLLPIAHEQKAKILEVRLEDYNEARGVNNLKELAIVREILRLRNGNHQQI